MSKSKPYKILANVSIMVMLLAVTSIAFADIAPPGPNPKNNPITFDNFVYTLQGHPPTSDRLTELGQVSSDDLRSVANELGVSPDSKNLLWLVSSDVYRILQSANITQGKTIQEYLVPGSSGELKLEETYPDGKNESSSLGYVRESYEYQLSFTANAPGKYIQRFQINGEYSNPAIINVQKGP